MTWIRASSHATQRPFIQIFSVFAMVIAHLAGSELAARSYGSCSRRFDHMRRHASHMAPDPAPAFFVGLDGAAERVRYGQLGFTRRGPFAQHERTAGISA